MKRTNLGIWTGQAQVHVRIHKGAGFKCRRLTLRPAKPRVSASRGAVEFPQKACFSEGSSCCFPRLMLFLNLMLNLLLLVLCIFDTAKCVSGFPVVLTKCYRTLTREIKTTSHTSEPYI